MAISGCKDWLVVVNLLLNVLLQLVGQLRDLNVFHGHNLVQTLHFLFLFVGEFPDSVLHGIEVRLQVHYLALVSLGD